jgi:outer membrane protein assembly factor BamD
MTKHSRHIAMVLLTIALSLSFFGCSRHRARRTMTIEQKMNTGNQLFERGKYNHAAEYYLDVVFERSSIHTPQAQFMLAESYYNLSRYADAIYEYRELIRLFPDFRNISKAYFRIGESYYAQSLGPHYSQQETKQAIDAFEVFLDRFPFHEQKDEAISYIQEAQHKLLEKKFYNGYIYFKMFDYSSAMMYFDEILELGLVSDLDRDSLYYAALIYIERQDRDNTERVLQRMLNHYPESGETNRIDRLFSRNFQE